MKYVQRIHLLEVYLGYLENQLVDLGATKWKTRIKFWPKSKKQKVLDKQKLYLS